MIIVVTLLALYWVFVHWLPFWMSALFALLYALSYWDGKEYTGERHWRAFREWRFWKRLSPIQYQMANGKDLAALDHRSMRLYMLVPGRTLASQFWGLGLHGGSLSPFAERLHWVVPPILLWIPVVRDVLMWAGAVTWHPQKLSLTSLLLQLLQSNRSVCFSPPSAKDGPIEMDLHLFEFALAHRIQMVPILVQNETQRYRILKTDRLQRWSSRHCCTYGWPQWALWRGRGSPPLIMVIGPILHCTERYGSPERLVESFGASLKLLSCPDLGEELFEIAISNNKTPTEMT